MVADCHLCCHVVSHIADVFSMLLSTSVPMSQPTFPPLPVLVSVTTLMNCPDTMGKAVADHRFVPGTSRASNFVSASVQIDYVLQELSRGH